MADTKKEWFSVTEKNNVNPTDKILVYDGTNSRLIKAELLKGAANLTHEYVELTGEDGKQYRVYVDRLGNAKAIKSFGTFNSWQYYNFLVIYYNDNLWAKIFAML